MTRAARITLLVVPVLVVAGCATSPPQGSAAVPPQAIEAPVAARPPAAPEPAPDAAAAAIPSPGRTVMLTLDEFVVRNDERLLQVYVGMKRRSMDQLMLGVGSGPYGNPFRRQSFTDASGKHYEVLYFLTRAPAAGRRVTENQLTPVILRDDRVVAIGRFPLKKLRRGECPGRRSACPP